MAWRVSLGTRNTDGDKVMTTIATTTKGGNKSNWGNMSVYSSLSSGPSSVFSSEEDTYEKRVREIEEYYVKTLLNEDEEEEEEATVDQEWNNSETSSVTSSSAKLPLVFGPATINNGKSVLNRGNDRTLFSTESTRKDSCEKKELEVKINSEYTPTSDLLPLTTENLKRLSLTSEKISPKSTVQIKKTTRTGHGGNSSGDDGNREEVNRGLYKTELCESFTTKGMCRYGSKCQFAHGLSELKFRQFGNNFRTKPCINWSKLGYCPYGKRCCFKHGSDQDIKVYLKAGTYLSNSERETKKNLHANVKALQKITW